MHQENSINKVTEGDINLTDARTDWLATTVDETTKALLDKDARYFFHQALSTPCLDVLSDCSDTSIQSVSG